MREFYRIGRLTGARPLTTYPIVVGAAIVVLAFLIKTGTLAPVCLAAALPAVFVLFIAELYRKQPSPLTNIAWEIAGIVYAAVPMALFVTLPVAVRGAAIDYSPAVLLSILFIVWANDVGAYLFGVAFGRRQTVRAHLPEQIVGRILRRGSLRRGRGYAGRAVAGRFGSGMGRGRGNRRRYRGFRRPGRIHVQTFGRNQRLREHSSGTRRLPGSLRRADFGIAFCLHLF